MSTKNSAPREQTTSRDRPTATPDHGNPQFDFFDLLLNLKNFRLRQKQKPSGSGPASPFEFLDHPAVDTYPERRAPHQSRIALALMPDRIPESPRKKMTAWRQRTPPAKLSNRGRPYPERTPHRTDIYHGQPIRLYRGIGIDPLLHHPDLMLEQSLTGATAVDRSGCVGTARRRRERHYEKWPSGLEHKASCSIDYIHPTYHIGVD